MFIPQGKFKFKKFRKSLKFKKCKEQRHILLKRGSLGLQCVKSGQISSVILESIRKSIIKRIKKIGKLYVFIFPNILLTKKPVGIRMGKGAGGANI